MLLDNLLMKTAVDPKTTIQLMPDNSYNNSARYIATCTVYTLILSNRAVIPCI